LSVRAWIFALQSVESMAKDASAQKALAQGSVVQPGNAQGDLSLTIYNNDLALVQDIRSLTLPNGHVSLDLPDVSARIRPETVTIAAANTSVIEQNFDYDLLSPQRLLDKSVGQDVSWCAPIRRRARKPPSRPACWPTMAARWCRSAIGSRCWGKATRGWCSRPA
jgi:hypothetical protein